MRGISFRRELRDVQPHLFGVVREQRLSRRLVRRIERPEIRIERRLRIDDDALAAGKLDDDVGT